MQALKQEIQSTFKLNGLQLRLEATKYLADLLIDVAKEEWDDWIEKYVWLFLCMRAVLRSRNRNWNRNRNKMVSQKLKSVKLCIWFPSFKIFLFTFYIKFYETYQFFSLLKAYYHM